MDAKASTMGSVPFLYFGEDGVRALQASLGSFAAETERRLDRNQPHRSSAVDPLALPPRPSFKRARSSTDPDAKPKRTRAAPPSSLSSSQTPENPKLPAAVIKQSSVKLLRCNQHLSLRNRDSATLPYYQRTEALKRGSWMLDFVPTADFDPQEPLRCLSLDDPYAEYVHTTRSVLPRDTAQFDRLIEPARNVRLLIAYLAFCRAASPTWYFTFAGWLLAGHPDNPSDIPLEYEPRPPHQLPPLVLADPYEPVRPFEGREAATLRQLQQLYRNEDLDLRHLSLITRTHPRFRRYVDAMFRVQCLVSHFCLGSGSLSPSIFKNAARFVDPSRVSLIAQLGRFDADIDYRHRFFTAAVRHADSTARPAFLPKWSS